MQQEMKKNVTGKLILGILAGIVCTVILMITSESDLRDTNTVCLWVLAGVYLCVFWNLLFGKYDMEKFFDIKKSGRKVFLVFISLVLTAVFFFSFPFQYKKVVESNTCSKAILGDQTITLEITGEKNEKSTGYDVWLEGIKVDGKDYNLYEIDLPENWEYKEDRPFTNEKKAGVVTIKLDAKKSYDIMLRKGPQAGKVKVSIGKNSQEIDLYEEKEEQHFKVDINKIVTENIKIDGSLGGEVCYSIVYIILLWAGSFTLIMWLYSMLAKEKHIKEKEME